KSKSKKVPQTKAFVKGRLDKINKVLNRVEEEVEGVFKRLVRQGERSSRELRKNFDDVLKRVKKFNLYSKAQEKTEDLEREIRKLADDIVSRVKGLEISPSGFTAKKLIREAKGGFENLVNVVESSDFVSTAIAKAHETRSTLLSLLKIPSQTDVEKLERKIHNLEKRLSNISHKAA
ncbi:MAG: hypothetical protein JNK65_03170, partial [Deltaproteobacteria bacterium]|nr:hypothetical protein [Deltaproteobacteria bacterium]